MRHIASLADLKNLVGQEVALECGGAHKPVCVAELILRHYD